MLHVVESSGARLLGEDHHSYEAHADQERLERYSSELSELGVESSYDLGFGEAVSELAVLVRRHGIDLVVMGGHGHKVVGGVDEASTELAAALYEAAIEQVVRVSSARPDW